MSQLTFRLAATLALASALLLAGCTSDGPIVLPGPAPTTAPVFATDEDALAAAEVAYGEYLKASDAITAKNGADPNTIGEYVDSDYLPEVLDVFEGYRADGLTTRGSIAYDSLELQQHNDTLTGPVIVAFYVCLDVTEARLFDSKGNDVTPPGRDDRVPLEVTMQSDERTSELLLKSSEVWTGADFCEK